VRISDSIWATLGVAATRDVVAIKRAYAARLRVTRPEDDPEGFRRLRAAYEAALALAQQPPRQITPPVAAAAGDVRLREQETQPACAADAVRPASAAPAGHVASAARAAGAAAAPAGVPRPSPQAEETAALRAAFDALWLALRPDSGTGEETLRSLLARLLDLMAGSRLTIQADAETALARLLADMSPRSDPLLEECVVRFGWEKQESQLSSDPAVLRVLARRRDVTTLDSLMAGRDPLADAFARLRQPAKPLRRWWRANVTQAQQWPELKLLARLQDGNSALLRQLDSTEVAWWERFQKQPKLSAGLLRIGGILVLAVWVGSVIAGLQGRSWHDVLIAVPSSTAVLLTLLLAKLYLIDWPTHLAAGRWRGRPPLLIELGWLGLMILTFGAAVLFRQSVAMVWTAAASGVIAGLWAIYVSGPLQPVLQNSNLVLANSRIVQALALNFALGWWWFIAVQEFSPVPKNGAEMDACSVGAIALMCAGAFGFRALRASWTYRLTEAQRRRWTVGLGLTAVGLGPVVWLLGASAAWRPLVAWLVVTFIVVHRAACGSFNDKQLKFRVVVLLLGMAMAAGQLSAGAPDTAGLATRVGALVLLAIALFNLAVSFVDQGRMRRRPA
jgi:hypothetical protein